jgi:hypothetical protein
MKIGSTLCDLQAFNRFVLVVICVMLGAIADAQSLEGSMPIHPNMIVGGGTLSATPTLFGPAPAGGLTLNASSDNPSVQVPPAVFIAAGATTATLSMTTTAVTSSQYVHITVSGGNHGKADGPVWVVPPSVSTLSVVSPSVGNTTGTVSLQSAPSVGPVQVQILSSNENVAHASLLYVQAGSSSVTFPIYTSPVSSPQSVTFTAYTFPLTTQATATLEVLPNIATSVTLQSSSMIGGYDGIDGTVTVAKAAPAGGLSVTLSSSQTFVHVPSTVTIPAGATTAVFGIGADSVSSDQSATITASLGYGSAQATLEVLVPGPFTMTLSPPALAPNGTSTATVYFLVAPTVPVSISLQSTTSQVTVPASVTMAAGKTSVTFAINSGSTSTQLVKAQITASANLQSTAGTVWIVSNLPQLSPSGWPIASGNLVGSSQSVGKGAVGTLFKEFQNVGLVTGAGVTLDAVGRAYAPSLEGEMFAIDQLTGAQLWNTGGNFESAAVGTNGVIYTSGTAIDAQTGEIIWGDQGLGSELIGPTGTLYTVAYQFPSEANGYRGSDVVEAVNSRTGGVLWQSAFGTNGPADFSRLALGANGTLYASLGGYAIGFNPATGAVIWGPPGQLGSNGLAWSGGPVINPDGNVLWVSSGNYVTGVGGDNLYLLNGAQTGAIWSAPFTVAGAVFTDPAVAAGGTIYIGANLSNGTGQVYALNSDGTQKWVHSTEMPITASVSVASDGTAYCPSGVLGSGLVEALNPATGSPVWTYRASSTIPFPIAIGQDGKLYFVTDDGNFTILK